MERETRIQLSYGRREDKSRITILLYEGQALATNDYGIVADGEIAELLEKQLQGLTFAQAKRHLKLLFTYEPDWAEKMLTRCKQIIDRCDMEEMEGGAAFIVSIREKTKSLQDSLIDYRNFHDGEFEPDEDVDQIVSDHVRQLELRQEDGIPDDVFGHDYYDYKD